MSITKHKITLTEYERVYLRNLVSSGNAGPRKLNRAYILLMADQGGIAWEYKTISKSLNIHVTTVDKTLKSFLESGLEVTLNRKNSSKVCGEKKAHLLALACSNPPGGRKNWSFRLLAKKMVELNYFESISHETVRQVLKKRSEVMAGGLIISRS